MPNLRPGRALPSAVRDLVGELLYRAGWTRPDRSGRGYLTVITFHRVLPDEALREYPLDRIAVSVDDFQWLVQAFGRCFACGSLAEMHRRWTAKQPTDRPLLAITFDDGQLDNFEHARPILERAGATASFFVPVDAVDGNLPLWHDRLGYAAKALLAADRPRALGLLSRLGALGALDDPELIRTTLARAKHLAPEVRLGYVSEIEAALPGPSRPAWDGSMSWEQLRELVRGGHEIGSHSLSHSILPLLGDGQLELEVAGSKARIESETGVPCESFCYPNGDEDDRVVAAVRRAGYLRAVTTAWGPNRPGTDPLRLSRCDMQGAHSRDRLGRLSWPRVAFRVSHHFPGPNR